MNMLMNVKNKKITMIGAARSGIAVANAVGRLGGKAKISEFKSEAEVKKDLGHLHDPGAVALEFGGHTRDFILDSDCVVLSPGVRRDIPPVQWAQAKGIEVIGEIEFAYRLCPCPIIAVTGSNGKTTTSTLIAEIFKSAGRPVALCGNIGRPFSQYVADLTPTDTVVLEISSFQLESTEMFKPRVAVWLNFSQNHLDRHKDLQEYFAAKARIFANQGQDDWAVLNGQQEELKSLGASLKAKVVYFNGAKKPAGIHNPNHLAAMAVAGVFGISPAICRQVFAQFKGVEHRQELVRVLEEVEYINDSKSTTPEAGRWALVHLNKPMIMICGGSDKHLDFSPLRALVKQKVKKMIVIGQTQEVFRKTFADVVPLQACPSLDQAVLEARKSAGMGDCVVLSPMCASFDMFDDYEHRGQRFKEIVRGLA